MSYLQAISEFTNKTVGEFIDKVVEKYELDKNELWALWGSDVPTSTKKGKSKETKEKDSKELLAVPKELADLTNKELGALCKAKNLKSTGTKQELTQRLLEHDATKNEAKDGNTKDETNDDGAGVGGAKPSEKAEKSEKKSPTSEKAAATKTSTTTTKSEKAPAKDSKTSASDAAKLKAKLDAKSTSQTAKNLVIADGTIVVRRNAWGRHEHLNTNLIFEIFDGDKKKVVGKQLKDGTVEPVNAAIIETCNQYKFAYVLPTNLNKNAGKSSKATPAPEEEEEFMVDDEAGEGEGEEDDLELGEGEEEGSDILDEEIEADDGDMEIEIDDD
jgi:hypothetical protein